MKSACDVVVVGGGISGLAAALRLARRGMTVQVFEKAAEVGGRGRTLALRDDASDALNQGPHAFYRNGAAAKLLKSIDVLGEAHPPTARGGKIIVGGVLHPLPQDPAAILKASFLSSRERLELVWLFVQIVAGRLGASPPESVDAWLARRVRSDVVRSFLRMFITISTYTARTHVAALPALQQLRMAINPGVVYPDDGWQPVLERLRQKAVEAGAGVVTGAAVRRVIVDEHGAAGVVLVDGTEVRARAVILAIDPHSACTLLGDNAAALKSTTSSLLPVRAACLDVMLEDFPAAPRVVFSMDAPLYLSVHSKPGEQPVRVHVARYLDDDGEASEAAAVERELEGLLTQAHPQWRSQLRGRRFLPKIAVTHAHAGNRPGVEDAGVAGVTVCGDWVGDSGMLSDAAVASAHAAADAAMDRVSSAVRMSRAA